MKKTTGLITSATLASALLIVAGCSKSVEQADLDRVLDVSYDTLYKFENGAENTRDEHAMTAFEEKLRFNFLTANPPVHSGTVGINLKEDGSFEGFQDSNGNSEKDADEADLFVVEIDESNGRLIASDATGSGNVRDQHFSGTGLLTGFLLGSLLSRQRSAGIGRSAFSNKKSTPKAAAKSASKSSSQSAKSRSGSGSHSFGK